MKRLAFVLAAAIGIAAIVPPASAPASGTMTFSLVGGQTTGILSCSDSAIGTVVVTSIADGPLIPQGAGSGGAPFSTIGSIGAGAISAAGTYQGSIQTFSQMQLSLVAGSASGWFTCVPTYGKYLPAFMYSSPPPNGQSGSTMSQGIWLGYGPNFATAIPAPQVSASAPAILYQTKGFGTTILYNGADYGANVDAILEIAYNNQGTALQEIYDFFNSGGLLAQGGNGFVSAALPTPAAPAPTCAPGGSNAQTQYFVKTAYVSHIGITAGSPEGNVTCAANTLLKVPNPAVTLGEFFWNVYASTTTGTEKLQTQGTSPTSGTNIPANVAWTSTATLAGSTNPQTQDTAAQCNLQEQPPSYSTITKICPYGNSQLNGPLEAAKAVNTPPAWVPPVYTNAGAATANSMHGAQFSCTFAAATTCSLGASYWTGAAVFASPGPTGCSVFPGGSVDAWFSSLSTNTGTLTAASSNSQTSTGVCWGP